jgi:hypothetical protein
MNAKMLSIAAVAGVLLGSTALVQAEEKMSGPSGSTPGHEMQQKGSVPGSPGASGYAPGRSTTGAGDRDDRTAKGDRDDRKMGDRDRDNRRHARSDRDDRKKGDRDRDDRKHAKGDRDDKTTGFGGRDRDDHKKFDTDRR